MSQNKNPNQHQKTQAKTIHIRPRNPFAIDPIMKKGGVHHTAKQTKRTQEKQALKAALNHNNPDDI